MNTGRTISKTSLLSTLTTSIVLALLIAASLGPQIAAARGISHTGPQISYLNDGDDDEEEDDVAVGEAGGSGLPVGSTVVGGVTQDNGLFTGRVTPVSDDGKCRLDIPAGTVGQTADKKPIEVIRITKSDDPPADPESTKFVGEAYDLEPSSLRFSLPITVTFIEDPATFPAGVSEEDLVIEFWDSDKWEELKDIEVDEINHTVSGKTDSFGTFVVTTPPGTPVASEASPSTTPAAPTGPDAGPTPTPPMPDSGPNPAPTPVTSTAPGTASSLVPAQMTDLAPSAPASTPATATPTPKATGWPFVIWIAIAIALVGALVYFLRRKGKSAERA